MTRREPPTRSCAIDADNGSGRTIVAGSDKVSRVVAHFEQQILSGELSPGDLLPSERTIEDELAVSRSTVREALGRLSSMGLVRSVHGSGTRVEAPSGRPITAGYQRLLRQGEVELSQLAQVRLPLETAIARLAARNRTPEQVRAMEQTQAILGNARGSLESQVRADLEFHALLAEASGNPLFGMVLAPIQELLIESRRRTLGRHGARLAFEHHAAILEAVIRGDEPAAEAAMRRHMEMNVQHLQSPEQPEEDHP
jgi:GntR family transcriptional repressor for pyruvate dehydrogenase complex